MHADYCLVIIVIIVIVSTDEFSRSTPNKPPRWKATLQRWHHHVVVVTTKHRTDIVHCDVSNYVAC